mmetsp:Transcript_60729/g.130451  ORF Transcript_60729/g.130451 Transcript_60729/m.130451 type:complete len:330 (+) Transcript_60729:52-1041(+)
MGACECSPAGLRSGGAQRCPCECEAYQAVGKASPQSLCLPADRGRIRGRTAELGRDPLHNGAPALFPPLRRRMGSVEAGRGEECSTGSDSERDHEWGDSGTRIHHSEVKDDGAGGSTTCGSSVAGSSIPSRSPSCGTNTRMAAGVCAASQGVGPTMHELASMLDKLNHGVQRLHTEAEGESETEEAPAVFKESLAANLSSAAECAAKGAVGPQRESGAPDTMPWVRRRINLVPTPRTLTEVEESTEPIHRTPTPAHCLIDRTPTPAHRLTLTEEDLASPIRRTPTPAHLSVDRVPTPAGGGQCGSPGEPKVGRRRHSRPRSKAKRREER